MENIKKIIREVLLKQNVKHDCGCGCGGGCSKAPILNEGLKAQVVMTENMKYHIDNKKPLTENMAPSCVLISQLSPCLNLM